jgi:hypothetical protein
MIEAVERFYNEYVNGALTTSVSQTNAQKELVLHLRADQA